MVCHGWTFLTNVAAFFDTMHPVDVTLSILFPTANDYFCSRGQQETGFFFSYVGS